MASILHLALGGREDVRRPPTIPSHQWLKPQCRPAESLQLASDAPCGERVTSIQRCMVSIKLSGCVRNKYTKFKQDCLEKVISSRRLQLFRRIALMSDSIPAKTVLSTICGTFGDAYTKGAARAIVPCPWRTGAHEGRKVLFAILRE